MTLVLSELTRFGIAMAADSAITFSEPLPTGDSRLRVVIGANKLQVIPKLNAGISIWGKGSIIVGDDVIQMDTWIENLIAEREDDYDSLGSLATLLASEANNHIRPIDVSQEPGGTVGFHLAGFVDYEGEPRQTFYHVHNGRSQALEIRGETVADPSIINANHDFPPYMARELSGRLVWYRTGNGDLRIYNPVIRLLERFLRRIGQETHIVIPNSTSITDRAEWLKFQIKTMAELYEFSNLEARTIGGDIATLTISADGTMDFRER